MQGRDLGKWQCWGQAVSCSWDQPQLLEILGMGILGSGKSGEGDECWGSGHTEGICIHTVRLHCWRTWNPRQCIIAKTRLSSCCWTLSSGGFLVGSLLWIMGYEQLESRLIWYWPQCTSKFLHPESGEGLYMSACSVKTYKPHRWWPKSRILGDVIG